MTFDFSKLRIPVHNIPINEDVVHRLPQLKQFEEFHLYPHRDRNKVIRYVIYAYDPFSPFVEASASNLKKRKEMAAMEAGFDRDKKTGLFPEEVQQIMDLQDEEVNEMIFCYLRIINNRTWSQIITNEQVFSEYTRLLMEPVAYSTFVRSKKKEKDDDLQDPKESVVKDDKKLLEAANMKAKLREECKVIDADLKVLYKDMFGENQDLKEKVTAKPIRPETH